MKTDIMIDFQVCIIVPLIAPQSIDYSPPDFSIFATGPGFRESIFPDTCSRSFSQLKNSDLIKKNKR